MIAVVTGGRDYRPTKADAWALRAVLAFFGVTTLRHGACRGVDEWAGGVGERMRLNVEEWPADWSRGPHAGPSRNRAMLDGPPTAVLCLRFPGGTGTANCAKEAEKRGIPVVCIGHEEITG